MFVYVAQKDYFSEGKSEPVFVTASGIEMAAYLKGAKESQGTRVVGWTCNLDTKKIEAFES